MVIRILITLMLLFHIQVGLAATAFHAEVDRTDISEGESVTLTLRYNANELSDNPDFTPLLQDFNVRNQGRKTSFQYINGNSEFWTIWTLRLTPKKLGDLTIPSIKYKDGKTQAINVSVTKLSAQIKKQRDKELFFHTEVDAKTTYVQGQVIYTERLYFSIPIENGTLNEVKVDEAIVEPLGSTRHYRTQLEGRSFDVYERQFAIFPQVSGEMIIPGPIYNGEVGHRMFGGGRAVSASHPPTRIAVNPKPASYPDSAAWLPAKDVTLDYRWLGDPTNMKVGDPLTLEITLRADGLSSAQLPDITLPQLKGLKVYPEQPQANDQSDGNGFVGYRRQSFALVTTRNGSLALPEIRIPWWDTQSQQLRYAVLPSQRITATGASQAEMEQNQAAQASQIEQNNLTEPVDAEPETTSGNDPSPQVAGIWIWLTLGFALLWIVTLVAWWQAKASRAQAIPANGPENKDPSARQWFGKLKAACRANDAKSAREALLKWMSHLNGQPLTQLSQLSAFIEDTGLNQAIHSLDQALYGQSDTPSWQGEYLWQLVKGWKPTPQSQTSQLETLYPNEVQA